LRIFYLDQRDVLLAKEYLSPIQHNVLVNVDYSQLYIEEN
jgi:hypothetical protein